MPTENIFIAHPKTTEQIDALKAIVKAFKIDFEITKKEVNDSIISELQISFNQVQEIRKGKLEKQSVKDFLDEL